jgi:phage gp46-like protein
MVPGSREYGVLFGERVYLFADEASLERFERNPDLYADRALQALRPEGVPSAGYR